jgi:hypothetical protein
MLQLEIIIWIIVYFVCLLPCQLKIDYEQSNMLSKSVKWKLSCEFEVAAGWFGLV